MVERCNGGELFDRIKRRGRYSEAEAAKLLRQLVSALLHMHRNGNISPLLYYYCSA